MKLRSHSNAKVLGFTLVEMVVTMGIATGILAAFTAAAVALQKSFYAIEDYAKGQNDQMRISDYLSLDLRRAYNIAVATSAQTGAVTVTLTLPNFYASANTPYDPKVTPLIGWPYKKHHHHKHKSIILQQNVDYGPAGGATTQTVVYTFNNTTHRLYRCVNGAVPPTDPTVPDPAGVTTIARDVADFNVTVSDLGETATTTIKFKPRFRTMVASPDYNADNGILGTTYFQTTLTRNTR
jgi:hypothetical protein